MSHACPVKNCAALAKREHLMCWPHWRRVPRILQRAVWDTFMRQRKTVLRATRLASDNKPVCSVMDDLIEARAQYDKAVTDAIAAVEAKEAA